MNKHPLFSARALCVENVRLISDGLSESYYLRDGPFVAIYAAYLRSLTLELYRLCNGVDALEGFDQLILLL